MMNKALVVKSIIPMMAGAIQAVNEEGTELWIVDVVCRTTSGTKVRATRQVAGKNAAAIKKSLRDWVDYEDAEEQKAPIAPPAGITIDVPVDTKFDPVDDWDTPVVILP
jgi:hypothetical protein